MSLLFTNTHPLVKWNEILRGKNWKTNDIENKIYDIWPEMENSIMESMGGWIWVLNWPEIGNIINKGHKTKDTHQIGIYGFWVFEVPIYI